MKIAYLTQSYPPMVSGAAFIAERLAKEMVVRGHKVLVVAASDQSKSYLAIKDNLTVLRLCSYRNPFCLGKRFVLYPRSVILHTLHEFQPEIIHANGYWQIGLSGLEFAYRTRIPFILTTHLSLFVSDYLSDTYNR